MIGQFKWVLGYVGKWGDPPGLTIAGVVSANIGLVAVVLWVLAIPFVGVQLVNWGQVEHEVIWVQGAGTW